LRFSLLERLRRAAACDCRAAAFDA